MSENRRQILEMLSNGKITADEAERLIRAVEKPEESEFKAAKYLRIVVESDEVGEHWGPSKVNVRVPMQLLRAGVKLVSLIPVQARSHVNEALKEHGIEADLSQIKPENLEALIDQLNDFTVDVHDRSSKVKIFCE